MRIGILLRLAPNLPKGGSEKVMMKGSYGAPQSKKVAGFLWLLAGLLMIVPAILSDGSKSFIAIGAMFLIFGIVFLGRRSPLSAP